MTDKSPVGLILSTFYVLALLAPAAHGFSQQSSTQILGVTINGDSGSAEVSVNGVVYDINANIAESYGDPTITTSVGYATFPEYIGNPPYAGWWNGISNPPEIYIYIDSGVALNSGNGVAGIAGLLSILAAATAGVAAGVAAAALVLLNADYSTIYGADHNPDGSLSLWIPVDWLNYVVLFEGSHDLYVATPSYWWLCLPGLAIRSNR